MEMFLTHLEPKWTTTNIRIEQLEPVFVYAHLTQVIAL